ncbi:MAG TPA: hypothetical protein VM010_06195, partial [Chitinophagaceae bacterium]|nr:hypothetical protein [Chitinophagaceae bacterium]
LISVAKEENAKLSYPVMVRAEGIPPSQYGTKSLLGEKFADVEEKYDLSKGAEGFSEEGEGEGDSEGDSMSENEESNQNEEEF